MRSETQRKGELAKCKILFRAYEKGIIVSIPTLDVDYDLILDVNKKLSKCQVKYVDSKELNRKGSVLLDLRRTTRNKKVLTYSKNEIDIILVYLPSVDEIICLPSKVWDKRTSLTIRIKETRNKQKTGVFWYKDYIW